MCIIDHWYKHQSQHRWLAPPRIAPVELGPTPPRITLLWPSQHRTSPALEGPLQSRHFLPKVQGTSSGSARPRGETLQGPWQRWHGSSCVLWHRSKFHLYLHYISIPDHASSLKIYEYPAKLKLSHFSMTHQYFPSYLQVVSSIK